jgi:hypothetical protein
MDQQLDTYKWSWTNKLISDSGLELFAELAPAILLLFLVIDSISLRVHSEQPAQVQPEAVKVLDGLKRSG